MYLLFDIGASNTRIGFSENGTAVDRIIKIPTKHSFEEMMDNFGEEVRKLRGNKQIVASAGGSIGPLNDDRSMIINAPNLSKWNYKPLKEKLGEVIGVIPFIENDCIMAGLGEAAYGSGKDTSLMVYMTISTGVGGARIIDGEPDRSRFGFEPGQQIIRAGDKTKTLEELVSGSGIEKIYGKKAELIDDSRVWEEVTDFLSIGIHNMMVHWSPETIILGGAVMQKISIDMIRTKTRNITKIFPTMPRIEKAILGESALWGALALLNKKASLM